MSYILDALRKSDQQRQRGATPTLLTAQATVAPPTRSGLSLNGWLALVLVGAGVLIGWLRPWQTDPPASTPEPVNARTLAASPAMPALPPVLPGSARELTQARQPAAPPEQTDAPKAARYDTHLPPPDVVSRVARTEPTTPMSETPAGARAIEAERATEVMPMNDLPASIRQEIQGITISFHVYSSNPVERRIMINNELLRQGESLSPGFEVERITPDGVVLNYKGYRFQRGVR